MEAGGAPVSDVCCLCGDVGFPADLLRCPRCRHRLQHSYCSRFYPDKIDMESWGCEWCVHDQQQQRRHEEEEKAPPKRARAAGGAGGAHPAGPGGGGGPAGPRRSSRAVDRWRKLARAAKLGSGRRYKLLADVICS